MRKTIIFSVILLLAFSSSVFAINEYEWTPGNLKAGYSLLYNFQSTTHGGVIALDCGYDDLLGVEASLTGQRSWYVLNGGTFNLDLNVKRKLPWEFWGIKPLALLGGGMIYSQASGSNALYVTAGGIAHRQVLADLDLKGYLANSFFSDGGVLNFFAGANYKGWQDKEITLGYTGKVTYLNANSNARSLTSYILLAIRSGW